MFNRQKASVLIKDSGRTKIWIAAQCRITVQTLHKYLSGDCEPSGSALLLLTQALGVSEDALTVTTSFNQRRSQPRKNVRT